jgi:hypothetical protein
MIAVLSYDPLLSALEAPGHPRRAVDFPHFKANTAPSCRRFPIVLANHRKLILRCLFLSELEDSKQLALAIS